jgi:monoamine oxidase
VKPYKLFFLGLFVLAGLSLFCTEVSAQSKKPKVIVIGAGISGLASASSLKDKGYDVLVLEAQEVVGGRLKTNRTLKVPFDEGASWIHGPKGNPITTLAQKTGSKLFLTDNDSLAVYDKNGKLYSEKTLQDAYQHYQDALAAVEHNAPEDRSFSDVFYKKYPQYKEDALWKYMLSAYLEFDSGGDISQLSAAYFKDDDLFPGKDLLVTDGYDRMAQTLAKGLDIQFNQFVNKVESKDKTIAITTKKGDTFICDAVVVSVPLGVYKNGGIRFSPELSTKKRAAIRDLQMGCINKFLLEFDSSFWDEDLQYIGFTPEEKGKFNYFLNMNKVVPGSQMLMTFAFGNYGRETETMSDAQVIQEIMGNLKAIYGPNIPYPKQMLRTKWTENPYTFGSYSYASKDTDSDAFNELARPEGRLFFAGEHTSKTYRGTVHGAYLSGLRAADEVAGYLK